MRLIVGCPVATRAWALPTWFQCLDWQTIRPDGFVFVHSGRRGDDTWTTIRRECASRGFSLRLIHDPAPPHPRHDNERFRTLADVRNRMLDLVEADGADLFLSLDSDVMLEDPRIIEHLIELVAAHGFDIASPLVFLHPLASTLPDDESARCWAYNAGWWAPGGTLDDPRRPWRRPPPEGIPWGEAVQTHIPMAAWLGTRRAIACRYRWHESGEDLGFAQDLDRQHLRVVWDTSLRARHIWSETDLQETPACST